MALAFSKIIIITENLLCIYRNYSFYGRYARALIIMRMIIEILISIAFLVKYLDYYTQEPVPCNIYFVLLHINSILLILIPWSKCYKFKQMYYQLTSNTRNFLYDSLYIKNLQKKQYLIYVAVSLFCIAKLYQVIYNRVMKSFEIDGVPSYYMYLVQLYVGIIELRSTIEYFTFSWLLFVMAEQLQCIKRYIDKASVSVMASAGDCSSGTQGILIDKWSAQLLQYTRIAESTKLYNSIYGGETIIMLATAVLDYIVLSYFITAINVQGQGMTEGQYTSYILTLVHVIILVFILACAAQELQNNFNSLKRRLAKLLINSLGSSDYKPTRDLVRLVSIRPIRPQALGSIDVNMSLLPLCVGFFTSYTVIALQFNNIL